MSRRSIGRSRHPCDAVLAPAGRDSRQRLAAVRCLPLGGTARPSPPAVVRPAGRGTRAEAGVRDRDATASNRKEGLPVRFPWAEPPSAMSSPTLR